MPTSYKPSAYYLRKALRESKTREEAVDIGMTAVLELEQLKAYMREHGLIPPKVHILDIEAEDKGWPG